MKRNKRLSLALKGSRFKYALSKLFNQPSIVEILNDFLICKSKRDSCGFCIGKEFPFGGL
ncbi:MAG: hypothetical protein RL141_1029 [Candidatus Parcubacteria bacterium]